MTACFPIETRGMKPLPGVRLVRTPMGERAPDALEGLGRGKAVTLLVSTGFCGGLRPELRTGDLVLADAVRHRGAEIPIAEDLFRLAQGVLDPHAARAGACESSSCLVEGAGKRELAAGGAVSVDMESGPLARWAAERAIPFLVLRVVLDPVDEDLPFAVNRPFAASLVRHPVRGLRAARAAARAGRRLGRALNDLLPALREAS